MNPLNRRTEPRVPRVSFAIAFPNLADLGPRGLSVVSRGFPVTHRRGSTVTTTHFRNNTPVSFIRARVDRPLH